MNSEIRDINLAPSGEHKIEWVRRNCPLLRSLEEEFARDLPFQGVKIALSIHLEAKTAYLCKVLKAGGADMYVTGSNPLSTQDDVAAALVAAGLHVYAWYQATEEEYNMHISHVLENDCNIIIDDGGDLVHMLHTKYRDKLSHVIGGCEETTTGIIRLRAMAAKDELVFPMVMVNDADCKHLFDNRYGTGQSVWDGINRTTNLIVAGKIVIVAGYGWCGKGVAMRAKGMGARVIVTEIDPVRAIEAVMDGFDVMPMNEAAKQGDFFVTVTGCRDVITEKDFAVGCRRKQRQRFHFYNCQRLHPFRKDGLDGTVSIAAGLFPQQVTVPGGLLQNGAADGSRLLFCLVQQVCLLLTEGFLCLYSQLVGLTLSFCQHTLELGAAGSLLLLGSIFRFPNLTDGIVQHGFTPLFAFLIVNYTNYIICGQ